jgi:hypothetical protein
LLFFFICFYPKNFTLCYPLLPFKPSFFFFPTVLPVPAFFAEGLLQEEGPFCKKCFLKKCRRAPAGRTRRSHFLNIFFLFYLFFYSLRPFLKNGAPAPFFKGAYLPYLKGLRSHFFFFFLFFFFIFFFIF